MHLWKELEKLPQTHPSLSICGSGCKQSAMGHISREVPSTVAPPLAIHSIPFIALRLSHFAGRPRFPSFGCSGGSMSLIRSHSLSVSLYRFVPINSVYIICDVCARFIFQTRPSLARSPVQESCTSGTDKGLASQGVSLLNLHSCYLITNDKF